MIDNDFNLITCATGAKTDGASAAEHMRPGLPGVKADYNNPENDNSNVGWSTIDVGYQPANRTLYTSMESIEGSFD